MGVLPTNTRKKQRIDQPLKSLEAPAPALARPSKHQRRPSPGPKRRYSLPHIVTIGAIRSNIEGLATPALRIGVPIPRHDAIGALLASPCQHGLDR